MHGTREHVAMKNKTECEPKPGFLHWEGIY